jgi:hypothetical protein
MVALGLVAVIVIIILIVARPGSGTPGAAQTPGPSGASATPSAASTNPADADACDPAKVTLDAATDSASYEAGVTPMLSFTLKSLMTTPCVIAAGSDVQEYRITSGDELIWSSKHCQTDPVAATTILMPGVPKAGPSLAWDRTRSATDTCGTDRPQVTADGASYHLQVIVGDLTSSDRQFLLY